VNLESTCFTSISNSDELFRYVLEELAEKEAKPIPALLLIFEKFLEKF